MAGPDLVQRHAAAHSRQGGAIGRGEAFHLRCTRHLLDPETGATLPFDVQSELVQRRFGLSTQTWGSWVLDQLRGLVLGGLLLALVVGPGRLVD